MIPEVPPDGAHAALKHLFWEQRIMRMFKLMVLMLVLVVGGAMTAQSVSVTAKAGFVKQGMLCEEPTRLGGG